MTSNAAQHNIAKIRKLLLAAFTPEELRRFCYDRPAFRPVVNRFGPGHGFDDMVDEVIVYCDTHVLADKLLAGIRQVNPRQYARHFGPEPPATAASTLAGEIKSPPATVASPLVGEAKTPPEDMRAEFTPQILTITSPITLDLVRVPAGEFLMGSVAAKDEHARDDEFPPHRVHVPEFHIGRYPVTNLQYRAFVNATECKAPDYWRFGKIPRGRGNHPVVAVSWIDTLAFCAWLRKETGQLFRLPTEAEWEKAARGTDGRIWPWGDEPPHAIRYNCDGEVEGTTPVGRYSPHGDSPHGCADMAGNVWEWCSSAYKEYPYDASDGREEMGEAEPRVLRGGGWRSHATWVRCASRNPLTPDYRDDCHGFRVAMGPLS